MARKARRLAGVDPCRLGEAVEDKRSDAWQECGTTLHGWASLHAWMEINGPTSAGFGELRHVAESHGLFPRALLSLRWIVAAAPVESTLAMSARSNSSGTDRRTRFLRAVAKVDGS